MSYRRDRRALDCVHACGIILCGAAMSVTVGADDGRGIASLRAARRDHPLMPRATLHGCLWHCPVLKLRGGEDAPEDGARGGTLGPFETDGRTAETTRELLAFTRSPSPIPANPAPDFPFSRSPSRSPSVDPSVYTRASSPHGLLIAMCAWESLHTIAVGMLHPLLHETCCCACALPACTDKRADGWRDGSIG